MLILGAMAIREILEVPDVRLKTVSRPVEIFDDSLKTLVDDMFETMYDARGIGLAAIQVGEPLRVLVIDLQEPDDEADAEECGHDGCGHDHRPVKKDPRLHKPGNSRSRPRDEHLSRRLSFGARNLC